MSAAQYPVISRIQQNASVSFNLYWWPIRVSIISPLTASRSARNCRGKDADFEMGDRLHSGACNSRVKGQILLCLVVRNHHQKRVCSCNGNPVEGQSFAGRALLAACDSVSRVSIHWKSQPFCLKYDGLPLLGLKFNQEEKSVPAFSPLFCWSDAFNLDVKWTTLIFFLSWKCPMSSLTHWAAFRK
jgi:hypothetical protein